MAGRQGLAVVMLFICILNTHCCNDIDLSEDTVMTIQGAGSFHHSGFNVRSAGDVNGDGFDDLIVGTFLAGVSHVVFGGPNRTNADLAGLGSRGFTIQGRQQDHTGEAVSGAGDVNGDGFHDIIVGEYGATVDGKLNAGKTYVILGGPNPTDVNVQNLGARGFTIHGAAPADRSGYSVSDAGDVNGDGFADIIIGAPWSNFGAGTSYVIYGASSPTDVDLSVSLGARGFIVYGAAADDRSGRSVAAAGDVNNDGFADVVIGAPDANPLGRLSAGIVYVIYGAASSTDVNASASLGDRAFVILGAVDQDNTGVAVRGAGDVNGDGYADVIMGAYLASRNGRVASGLTYVIYGGASPSDVDLRDQLSVGLGTRGFLLLGAFTWDMSGIAVSGAGDVNGDGLADVIVGAHGTDPLSREAAGVSYVIFGAPQPTNIDLRRSLGTRGFVVRGAAAEDASGYSVSAAGDVDGDGVADVVIAAPTADPMGRTSGGSSYVLAGCAAVGCSAAERSLCSDDAWCTRADDDTVTCTCADGLLDVHGNGSVCEDVNECEETAQCHVHAECENTHGSFFCVCAAGFVGDGASCSGDAWAVRTVFAISEASELAPEAVQELKHQYAMLVAGRNLLLNSPLVTSMPVAAGALHYGDGLMEVDAADGGGEMTLMALFAQESDAQAAVAMLESVADAQYWQLLGAVRAVVDGPKLYRWSVDPIQVNPTGLTVDSVWFDSSCLASGCWRIAVTFTAGSDNVNVLYLPRTDGADDLSYDQSYDDVTAPWSVSPEDTFDPRTLPCTTVDYERSQNPLATPASVTACCIPEFVAMFRPVSTFEPALSAELKATMSSVCGAGARDRDVTRASIPIIAQRGQPVGGNVYARPVAPEMDGMSGDVFQAESHGIFGHGRFAGMPLSRVNATATVDAYVGVYRATVFLDEVEARTLAGRLRGTVGVEHSVDTFVGLAEFSPTGQFVLDPFMTQTNIHLEKTGFFSVSTHGTNDYTFLQYVNLRLVAVYAEEGGDVAGAGARTARVNATNAAHYVQVTFTLGDKHEVNTNSGLVPLDSVRAGAGTFVDAEGRGLAHKCTEWVSGSLPRVSEFNATLMQSCAPAAAMCVSPSAIPDSFVAFNVPLGVDFFAAPSDSLSNNVFVDMVISAVDTEARGNNPQPTDPNGGEAPWQMKTTLTASIPVVEGGVNIFCDGYTAKTDLQDVANADVVVGTASSAEELTRLRIKEDIASTQLSESAITQIDSDSIEAGLMTLVLKGDASYFESNTGRREVTLELEDVITIHVMESDTGQGQSADVASSVLTLVTTAPADAGPEDTDSYGLNGAFKFTIDRSAQRAHLEPTDALLVLCPFSAPWPANNLKLETCVTRRDVRHRGFPHRSGAVSTAMEICAGDGDCSDETTSSHEARFMVSVLGDSAYARQLAVDYATVIADAYSLNGRYKRAYWINPGYEWTPTQTGGTPLFSVSQKLFLFALVTLDEGVSTDDGAAPPALQLPSRRRMLLQSTPEEALQDGQAALNADAFEFQTSPTSMMAKAFDVPEDRVATFKVTLQLTSAEACMATTELQASIRTTLDDFVSGAASAFHTVQVASLALDRAGVQCSARRRVLLSSYIGASAEVTMLVVFKAGGAPAISLSQLLTMPGVAAVEPLTVPAHVDTTPDVVRPSSSTSSKSSNSAVLIAAAAGGSVAAVVVAAVGVLLLRRNKVQVEMATVHSVDVTALKRELEDDL